MTDEEIRASIQATFRPAEEIWNGESPFPANSTWVGYLATEAQAKHVSDLLQHTPQEFEPRHPKYKAVQQLLFALLPEPGQKLFRDGGYDQAEIETSNCKPWTPSVIAIALYTTPTGEKYIQYICGCG